MRSAKKYAGRRIRVLRSKLRLFAIRTCLAGRFAEDGVLMLTSSPRSGSTWLANALGSIPNSCVLFEPLHITEVPEAKAAGFAWRTFVYPGNKWIEGETHLRRVFEGKIVNEWTSREMSLQEACQATIMIIKFVRANRLLPWMCQTFKIRSPILLIRHPCAVIASQLNSSNWANAERPEIPPYITNYPLFESTLAKTQGVEEILAATWALDQLPPLIQETPRPWMIITYEELFLCPEVTLTRIFQTWDLDVDVNAAISRLKKPSSMVNKSGISGIDGWRKQLTDKQVSKILNTVERFGLCFYTRDIEPDYDALNSGRLPEQIRKAGIGSPLPQSDHCSVKL